MQYILCFTKSVLPKILIKIIAAKTKLQNNQLNIVKSGAVFDMKVYAYYLIFAKVFS